MVVVWLATFPAMFWGMYNMGYFGLDYMAKGGFTSTGDWHNWLIQLAGTDVNNHFHRFWFGLVYFVPIYVTVFVVGIACEAIFATIRRHEINEGAFVSTVLFSLSCPPDIPLWQAATGIAFGIVVGKEFFGGTGKNFLNPALTGRAFIYFAYPSELSGDMVWVASLADNGAIDGYSGATALGIGALEGLAGMQANFTWGETFFGQIPGSIGETSTFLILLAGAYMVYAKIASWRIIFATLIGMFLMSSLLNFVGSDTNPMFDVPWYWHLTIGSFAFGLVYMATEPVTAASTNMGRWIYGFAIGILVVLIRVVNPAFPEGMMLAILFANLLAPAIDFCVTSYNTGKRMQRYNS
jgi:Na+-transporting NADH:ubiquinone oxidoreductase subunit B